MGIKQVLDELNETFIVFNDPRDKFAQLLDMAKNSANLSKNEKINSNKIYGCSSQAWVVAERINDNKYIIRTDSDALIVKGLLVILEKVFSNQPADKILSTNSNDILKSIGLEGSITNQRTHGFSNAVKRIQELVQ